MRDLVEIYARAVTGVLALEKDAAKRAKYMEFIDSYASLTDSELRRYQQEGNIVAEFYQRAREEAIERGRAEGGRAVLERLLRRRFGDLSPEATERLRRAPEAELADWTDRLLDATTLDEVFGVQTLSS